MDIHAPESPIASLRDFGIHIAVVTVGIMIALGLDGLREAYREHRLVRETRENFREELTVSHHNMLDEIKRVTAGHDTLVQLAKDAPTLAQHHPDQVVARLESIQNPYYFFSTNSWQAALSTGALAHMSSDEASKYAWTAEGTRIYVALQTQAMDAETRALAFWRSHPHPTADQITDGEERILLFTRAEESLAYVAPQTQGGFEHALQAASR